jgi:hypothetical protein
MSQRTASKLRLLHLACLLVPALTLSAAAWALLTRGAPRTLIGVRLLGGPTVAGPQSLLVQCVRRAVGVIDLVPLDAIELSVDGQTVPVACGADGHGEAAIRLGHGGRVRVEARRAGVTLATGEVEVSAASWAAAALDLPARLPSGGVLPIQAFAPSGSLPLGHPTPVLLRVPEPYREPGALVLAGSGADLGPSVRTSEGLLVEVRPIFPTASLAASAGPRAPAHPPGGWEARLPVIPAGLLVTGLAIEPGRLRGRVLSTSGRRRAYLRVQDQGGRVAASSLDLSVDGQGLASAPFALETPPLRLPAWLLLSPDPVTADGAQSVPLVDDRAPHDGRIVPDAPWLDGLLALGDVEDRRLHQVNRAVGLLVLAGGLAEALLLGLRNRMSRQELAAHLAANAADSPLAPSLDGGTPLGFLMAVGVILLGFGMLALILMSRLLPHLGKWFSRSDSLPRAPDFSPMPLK